MKKPHIVLLAANLAMIVGFGGVFLVRLNYEFIIYVGIIIFFLCLIGATLKRVDYTSTSLVGLTVRPASALASSNL